MELMIDPVLEFADPTIINQQQAYLLGDIAGAVRRIGRDRLLAWKSLLESDDDGSGSKAEAWLRYYCVHNVFHRDDWFKYYIRLAVSRNSDVGKDLGCLLPFGMTRGLDSLCSTAEANVRIGTALKSDSVSMFELYRSLGLVKLNGMVVRSMLNSDGCAAILEHLISNEPQLPRIIRPRAIFLFACAACKNVEKSLRLLNAVEKIAPGQARCSNVFGWSPLHYTLFKQRHLPDGNGRRPVEVEERLISLGCDPDHADKHGLSWRKLAEELYGKA